ncbi:redoxin family protein [Primorskyibacter sp. S87]|uniref:redoxin family protein n=1 Tax=Primorskyibacter sp. S87 TaxID=3415126 RepID=UPI003C797333
MAVSTGDKLPDAKFQVFGDQGPYEVTTDEVFSGRRVAAFSMPGAFTRGCSAVHLPSVVSATNKLKEAGLDDVVILSVNDPFVLRAWGESTGAFAAGIKLLADASASFTEALGMTFSHPPTGLLNRSRRFSMLAENRVVTIVNVEPGLDIACSTGEVLLEQVLGS